MVTPFKSLILCEMKTMHRSVLGLEDPISQVFHSDPLALQI